MGAHVRLQIADRVRALGTVLEGAEVELLLSLLEVDPRNLEAFGQPNLLFAGALIFMGCTCRFSSSSGFCTFRKYVSF